MPSSPKLTADFRAPKTVIPPKESGIAHLFAGADLVDAYAIALPPETTRDIEALARAVLSNPATWITVLLGVRDAIMVNFGVKTSRQIRQSVAASGLGHIDFFKIETRSDPELVAGEDDRHLDFKASILLRPRSGEGGEELVFTTVVHCHIALGRVYLALIAPFHRRVVRSNLRQAAARGWPVATRG